MTDVVRRMAASLTHRGPDEEGYFADDVCALEFCRQAIRDIGAAGRGPQIRQLDSNGIPLGDQQRLGLRIRSRITLKDSAVVSPPSPGQISVTSS